MREVERAQSGCSQGQKSSISALWAQTEVTWSALLLLETQQMGGPTFSRMFLGSKWPTHKLLFNCLDHCSSKPLFLLSVLQRAWVFYVLVGAA